MTPTSEEQRKAEHLANLKTLIHSPSTSFTPGNTLEKEIWTNDELSRDILKTGIREAQRDLEAALIRQIAALENEANKLRFLVQHGRNELRKKQGKSVESMKSDLCVMVHQRWTFERQTEELVGEDRRVESVRQGRGIRQRADDGQGQNAGQGGQAAAAFLQLN